MSVQEMKPIKEGKVREIYDNGDTLIMVATDRISCFDVILDNTVTKKGTVLTQMSKFWFDMTEDVIPNHMVSADVKDMPEFFRQPKFDGNSMMCKKLNMLPIECIVRGYITGSGWESYKKNGTVCGIKLPEGLKEADKLPEPIYTRIYQFMHGDHLKTVFSARETARNAMIPTMILQPVVENSLKYGLRSQEEDSEIRVHAYTQDGKLLITIRDNGKGLTQEQMEKLEKGETAESSSSGIGMANARQRLKLIYGDKSSISFRNRTAGGVKVTIEIPFTYSEPDSLWELEQMDDWSDLDELW